MQCSPHRMLSCRHLDATLAARSGAELGCVEAPVESCEAVHDRFGTTATRDLDL